MFFKHNFLIKYSFDSNKPIVIKHFQFKFYDKETLI